MADFTPLGPFVEVDNAPEIPAAAFSWVVTRTYKQRDDILWSGKLTFCSMRIPLVEFEATLRPSTKPDEEPFLAWPRRPNGSGGWMSVVWFHHRVLMAAAQRAVSEYLANQSQGIEEAGGMPTPPEGDGLPW